MSGLSPFDLKYLLCGSWQMSTVLGGVLGRSGRRSGPERGAEGLACGVSGLPVAPGWGLGQKRKTRNARS